MKKMVLQGYFSSLTCAVYPICEIKMLPTTAALLHFEPHCGLGLAAAPSGESRDFA